MSISRVIEVSFGGGSIAYAKVDTAYFYNNGILFKPTDIDLPASYQVHWADSPQASSTLETIGTAEGAPIPDDLWDRSRVIYGWIYLHPTEDSGITAYEVRIYKNVRAGLPDGTEPTPAEQSTIDQLIGALNSAVEQTGEDAESAEQAKDDAESARDNAQTYANNAQASAQASARSAESASESARVATEKATASAQSASASAQIKADVEDLVDDAQSYAKSALIASQASVTARNTAQGYAQSASASAQSASTSASNASASANTASSKASEASTSAQTASQKATEATQSASQALTYKTDAESAKTASQTAQGLAESARDSAITAKTDAEQAKADAEQARDEAQQAVATIGNALADKADIITDTASGAIASFTDGADLPLKSLIVDIDPIQDLHGYDSPWPAGGGANKFDVSTELTGYKLGSGTGALEQSANYCTSDFIPVSANTDYYFLNVARGVEAVCVGWYDSNKEFIATNTISGGSDHKTSGIKTSPSNASYARIVHYVGIENVALNYPSTVTTYAPYENLCPISGWTQVDVEQRGKNLFDSNFSDYTKPYNYYICPIKLENGKRYKLKAELVGTTITGATLGLVKSGNRYEEFVGPYYVVGSNGDARDFSITIDDTFTAPKLIAYVSGENQFNEVLSNYNVMLMPYEQADYEPYSGQSIAINLGQTVYGGKLDVLSGELVIDRAMVDLGTLDWNYEPNYNRHGANFNQIPNIKIPGSTIVPNALCSKYKIVSSATGWANRYTVTAMAFDATHLRVYNDGTADAATYKIAMSGVQLVYELATPIEIQLSANQINSLYGVNNLWADSGDTEVVYRADTKLFIERLTAPDSADMIADANITSGQYFMVGNTLYKATANIANGSAIVVGTNCIRKSLSEALNEINA